MTPEQDARIRAALVARARKVAADAMNDPNLTPDEKTAIAERLESYERHTFGMRQQ